MDLVKKLFYFTPLLLLPGIIFARVNYARSIPDPVIPLTTAVDVTATDYDREINCGGLGFWGIQAVEHETGKVFSGSPRFVSSDTLDATFALDIPPGDYEEITFICSDDGENLAFQYGSLENDLAGDQIIFAASDDSSITSDLSDGKTVTASIDGDIISEENSVDQNPVAAETETALQDDPSEGAASALEIIIPPEPIVEEIEPAASGTITGDF